MIIFLSIYFSIIPFLKKIIKFNELSLKTIDPLSLLFLFFGSFQLISITFIETHTITFNQYSILVWLIFSLYFLFVIGLFLYLFINKKLKINLEILKKATIDCLPFYGIYIIFFIILLFMNNTFMDTDYYMSISALFKNNSFFSSNGINILSKYYSCSSMYFVYPVLSNNFPSLYLYFNVLIYGLVLLYIADNFFDKWWIRIISMIAIVPIMLVWSYSTTAGNMVIQAAILVVGFYFLTNKNYFAIIIYSLYLQFLSITGILTTIILLIGTFIYMILNATKKQLLLFAILLVTIFISYVPLVFVKYNNIFVEHNKSYLIICIIILAIQLLSLIASIFIFTKLRSWTSNIKIENEKVKKIGFITINALFILFALLTFILWGFIYQKNVNFNINFIAYLAIPSAICLSGLVGYNIYCYVKKKQIKEPLYWFNILNIGSVLALIIILLVPSLKSNESVWRFSYLNIFYGTIADILLLSLMVINYIFRDYEFKFKWYIKNKEKIKSKKILMICVSIVTLGLSGLASGLSYVNQPTYNNINLSSANTKIANNLNILDNHDLELIKKLNVTNDSNIISGLRIMPLLGKGKEVSGLELKISSHIINAYGFKGACEKENIKINDNEIFALLQKQIDNLKTNSKAHNYLFINKNEPTLINLFRTSNKVTEYPQSFNSLVVFTF